MRLQLKCRCGGTEFDYAGFDKYECQQCGATTLVATIGTAILEVSDVAPQEPIVTTEIADKLILEGKIRRFLDAYLFSTGAYGYTFGMTSKKDGAFIFEVTETSPVGRPTTYPLAVLRSDSDEDVYDIVNCMFEHASSFNIKWTLTKYNEVLGTNISSAAATQVEEDEYVDFSTSEGSCTLGGNWYSCQRDCNKCELYQDYLANKEDLPNE